MVKPHNFLLKMNFSFSKETSIVPKEFNRIQSYIILQHSKTLKKVIFVIMNLILYRYIVYKSDSLIAPIATKSPEAKKRIFLDAKERQKEAPFVALEKKLLDEDLK